METKYKRKLEYSEKDYLLKDIMVYGIAFFIMMIGICVIIFSPFHNYIVANITNSNLIPYVVLLLIFIFSVLISNYIILNGNLVQRINKCNPMMALIIGGVIIILNIVALIYMFMTELDKFDAPAGLKLQYHLNNTVSIVFMTTIFMGAVYYVESLKGAAVKKENKLFFYLFVLIIAFFYGYTLFTPNCLGNFGNAYNSDAYFFSVYRAMMGVPRSYLDTGIYGFYGMLLAPIVKLAGGTITSFYIIIAFISGICVICIAYAIDAFVKNPLIKVTGTLALTVTIASMQWGIYNQLYPHRIFFPALLTAYMVYIYKHEKNGIAYTVGGYLLCAFSMIWNIETGFFCVFAWVAFELLDTLAKYSIIQFSLYKNIIVHLAAVVASFLGALSFVNVVNILMGGGLISIKEFMFPLLTGDFMSGYLTTPLSGTLSPWILVVGMYLALFAHSIMKTKLSPVHLAYTFKDKAFFGISVLGLGQITYYINRTAYGNLSICHFTSVLCLCIIADWSLQKYTCCRKNDTNLLNSIYRSVAYITITVLLVIILGGISNYYSVEIYKSQGSNNYRDTEQIENFAKEIERSIPKDTRAIGNGTAEIYSYLHWDLYYYIIDFSDLGVLPEAAYYMNDELAHMDKAILVNSSDLEKLDKYSQNNNKDFYESHVLIKTFKIYESEFDYYEPIPD